MTKLGKRPKHSPAFTYKELPLVIALISGLLCVQLLALNSATNQAKVAQCAANLKQYDLSLQLYASDNQNALPTVAGGNYPWDIPATAVNVLVPNSGLTRQNMYCPGFPEQNVDQMWNYSIGYNNSVNPGVATSGYRATGYATTLSGSPRVLSDDVNRSVSEQQITLSGSDVSLGSAGSVYHIVASQRPLLADATISSQGQVNPALASTYQWTGHTEVGITFTLVWQNTPYGPWLGSSTPHMAGIVPAGGNIGMLDGHVEWRPFSNMIPRTTGSGDVFWW